VRDRIQLRFLTILETPSHHRVLMERRREALLWVSRGSVFSLRYVA
jgi:hypothetical protein